MEDRILSDAAFVVLSVIFGGYGMGVLLAAYRTDNRHCVNRPCGPECQMSWRDWFSSSDACCVPSGSFHFLLQDCDTQAYSKSTSTITPCGD
jgi:hypothetical protein